jgi:hypothetical protein
MRLQRTPLLYSRGWSQCWYGRFYRSVWSSETKSLVFKLSFVLMLLYWIRQTYLFGCKTTSNGTVGSCKLSGNQLYQLAEGTNGF